VSKVIVFSAIFGGYDDVKEPLYENIGVDFILFTDNRRIKSKRWQIVYVNSKSIDKDPQRAARYVKVNPQLFLPENHTMSIWVDANYRIMARNITDIIRGNTQYDMITYRHPKRNGAYDEIKACLELQLDEPSRLLEQKRYYEADYFPKSYGLFHTAVMIRKNNQKINDMNRLWWEQIDRFSKRDQISLPFVIWRMGINVGLVSEVNLYHSKYFKKSSHKKERTLYA
jgi:hypothetical protein